MKELEKKSQEIVNLCSKIGFPSDKALKVKEILKGLSQTNSPRKLTLREQEVLELIIHEYSSKEIAEKLLISYRTVMTHRGNLMNKLGCRNIAGLVRCAFKYNLVSKENQQIFHT